MGNYNFRPQSTFGKNQPVEITGFKFTEEQVPKEIKTLGRGGYALQTTKLYKSRPNAPEIYVTRVKFPKSNKYETFLTSDLKSIKR
jgi:hypothetical protein